MNSYDNKRKILFPTDIFKFKLTLICLLTKLTKIPYNIEMIKFEPSKRILCIPNKILKRGKMIYKVG